MTGLSRFLCELRSKEASRLSALGEAAGFAHEVAGIAHMVHSREKRKAAKRSDRFFREDSSPKKWDTFLEHANRKSFVKQVARDPRGDDKLARHADSMNRLMSGRAIGRVKGRTGTYKIIKLRGKKQLGCTCADWRYKRSVAAKGKQDCRHIVEFKARAKTAS